MTSYTVTLFLHLVTVGVAFGAAALIHFGLLRMRKADTVAVAREGLMLMARAGRAMPIIMLALLLTGAYMTQSAWSWSTPWIDISIIGLVLMGILGGGVLGRRMRAVEARVTSAGDGPIDSVLAPTLRDPSLWILAQLPPLLAIGVMFVMTTKPGMGLGLVELLVVVALGVLLAAPSSRRAAERRVPAGE